MPQQAFITGDKALDRALSTLANKTAEKAVTSGIRAGLGELRKSIRTQINRPSVRKVVASRFKRKKKQGQTVAKVGAGVGTQKKTDATRSRPGKGISKQNAHWYFLGTVDRVQRTTGRRTGRMPPNPAVRLGASLGHGAAMRRLQTKTGEVIQKEARKLKGK